MRNSRLLSLTGRNISATVFENAKEVQVTCIDFNKNKLNELPEELSIVKTVLDLKLSHNNLSTVPQWLGESLKNLRFIDLSKNMLTELPESFSALENMIEVNISYNR